MFDDQELHERIQAFREMDAEIELQPVLDFLAATRARTVGDDVPYRVGSSQLRLAQA